MDFSNGLSQAYAMAGDYKAALEAHRQYVAAKDSIFSIENAEKIAALETRRARELKDKDIQLAQLALAKKRNEQWFFVCGIVALLAVIGVLFRNYKKQRRTNELLSVEKKRSDELQLNILPSQVADELKQAGESAARHYNSVTVMFTDFVDFTQAGERMTPEELVRELHDCFRAFDTITALYGIEKIKTIGDAYLAVAGLPTPAEDHAHRMLMAAFQILDFMSHRKESQHSFDIRIGLHSGPVVAGIVGVKKFAYDIWGDTVNNAARMEQNSEAGKINISQSTYDLVRDQFDCSYRGEIAVKHKRAQGMYFADCAKEKFEAV